MKIYLAARYGRRDEMLANAKLLESLGHEVTSRWILGKHELSDMQDDSPEEIARWLQEDCEDLEEADLVISFTEHPKVGGRNRGGRHVEFGLALAKGKRLFIVGPCENLFHFHQEVQKFENFTNVVQYLKETS